MIAGESNFTAAPDKTVRGIISLADHVELIPVATVEPRLNIILAIIVYLLPPSTEFDIELTKSVLRCIVIPGEQTQDYILVE